ncbi:hypothetical protein, variant [Spizellomyces punctatus DAOM BR117]|nr:hypothetical protein, variant [Spizellomyces punctatus DAOM BR117]KNC97499.1 hypothetical protein, variant [Spizellomyces punctatus DAOM BR117]|eukprot:XP_016605539.1 hypothetical protein, variant [Spizellomyces punctatus DAOM BR117]
MIQRHRRKFIVVDDDEDEEQTHTRAIPAPYEYAKVLGTMEHTKRFNLDDRSRLPFCFPDDEDEDMDMLSDLPSSSVIDLEDPGIVNDLKNDKNASSTVRSGHHASYKSDATISSMRNVVAHLPHARMMATTTPAAPAVRKRRRTPNSDGESSEGMRGADIDQDDLYLSDDALSRPRPVNHFKEALKNYKSRKKLRLAEELNPEESFTEGGICQSSEGSDEDKSYHDNSDSDIGKHPDKISSDYSDDDLQGFIVDEGVSDAEALATLPSNFRLVASTLFDSFRIFVEMLLEMVVDPSFGVRVYQTKDDQYLPHVRALENRLSGYRISLVSSEVWQPDFRRSLDTCPRFRCWSVTRIGDCDACARSNRPASKRILLSGWPYNPDTLQPLQNCLDDSPNNDNSEFDEPDLSAARTRRKRKSPAYTYNVGRYCFARSRLYHKLRHFKYAMQEKVKEWTTKQSEWYADSRLSFRALEEDGLVEKLWADFENLTEHAEEYAAGETRSRWR